MPRSPLSEFEKKLRKEIANNLKKHTKRLTQQELSEMTKIPSSTLSGYFAERSTIKAGNTQKIADALGIDKQDIDPRFKEVPWSGGKIKSDITAVYNQLNPPRQEKVLSYSTAQLKAQKLETPDNIIKINHDTHTESIDKSVIEYVSINSSVNMRIADTKVSAGGGIMVFDDADVELVRFPEDEVYDDSDTVTGFKVSGDSMQPKYHEGDIIWVDAGLTVEVGQTGVFNVDGEVFVKKQGQNKLISLNTKYKDININEHTDYYVIGKVIDFTPAETFERIGKIRWEK